MSQFEVIKDIGETVKTLLEESFKAAGFTTVNISTDKPKKDNIKNNIPQHKQWQCFQTKTSIK